MSAFDELVKLNVNEHTEKKKTGGTSLTYLSWTWAVAEVLKRYPDMSYTVWRDPVTHLPYTYDEATGYMVFTSVTIEGVTREMWLPVMDGANKAMKSEAYTVKTKYKEFEVAAASMFDVNKTIMRCLVKNFAMFGLGLYIYSGEDLPEGEEERVKAEAEDKAAKKDAEKRGELLKLISDNGIDQQALLDLYGIKKGINDFTGAECDAVIKRITQTLKTAKGRKTA